MDLKRIILDLILAFAIPAVCFADRYDIKMYGAKGEIGRAHV